MWSHSLHGERGHARKPEPLEGGWFTRGSRGEGSLSKVHTPESTAQGLAGCLLRGDPPRLPDVRLSYLLKKTFRM